MANFLKTDRGNINLNTVWRIGEIRFSGKKSSRVLATFHFADDAGLVAECERSDLEEALGRRLREVKYSEHFV